jgi:hypothetical protein
MENEGFSWGKVNGADRNSIARRSDSRSPRRESGQKAAKKGKLTKSSKEASLYGSLGLDVKMKRKDWGWVIWISCHGVMRVLLEAQ